MLVLCEVHGRDNVIVATLGLSAHRLRMLREREKEKEREREREREREGKIDRYIYRERETDRERESERERESQIERQTDREKIERARQTVPNSLIHTVTVRDIHTIL